MKIILLSAAIVLICFGFVSTPFAQKADDKTKAESVPKWLQEHFAFMTAGTGRWIADNSKFKNENEQFDEYGTEWTWGVGKQSIKGRLFGLNGKKEVGAFWEYRLFWHPAEKRAVLQQFGAGGVFGIGEMRIIELPGGKSENITEVIFYAPDGSGWKDLHKLAESKDEHTTQSFAFKDGRWQPRRTYIWRRAPALTAIPLADPRF